MGKLLLEIAFGASLLSFLNYALVHFGKMKTPKFARLFYHLMAVSTIGSAAFLLYLIITHQFQYTYVWNHSSTDLPFNLLISTFYAGQEGSFHLWALWMSIIGIFLLAFTSKRDEAGKEGYEPQVMGMFTLIQTFVLFILILKTPYLRVWESFPNEVKAGFVPEEGRGLNPLLQNFWMTIHPPILFAGFSSMVVPFCFAIAALVKNRYDMWVKLALPWTLFASMVLGFGIMLGGYWAYGVLGWGGYWGWDPVENSSLVPWITCIAGIHFMISSGRSGGYLKSSLLMCIISYVLVLYSTFLTRSGVLGDASVHSFVDPGSEVYLFLVIFLGFFTLLGIGLIFYRLKHLRLEKKTETNILSKETALFIGAVTLSAAALVILVGTSWPIIAKATVDPAFYNRMNLPIAMLIMLMNGFSILLKWKHTEEKQFIRSLILPVSLSAAVTIIMVILGMRDWIIALFAVSSLFCFFINIQIAYTVFRKSREKAGAYIAHVGIALLFLGVIGSARYSEEVNLSLPLNQPTDALGYRMTYIGATPIKGDEEKYHFNVKVEKDDRLMILRPVMYYSTYSDGVMKNPDIANLVLKDLYLSPTSLEVQQEFSDNDVIEIKKGGTAEAKGLKIKFKEFNMLDFNRDEMMSGGNQTVGADILAGNEELTVKIKYSGDGTPEYIATPLKNDSRYELYLTKINVSDSASISLAVVDKTEHGENHNHVSSETLILTASIKPYINLVWSGTIVIVAGFFFSILKRYRALK